jgi:hypothetical protein
MEYQMQHQWGEGSDSAMGITEVPQEFTPTQLMGTKRHGMQPPLCNSTPAGHETSKLGNNKVIKRSIRRAYRRSLHSGFAWYRGKHYRAADFAQMGCTLPEAQETRGRSPRLNNWIGKGATVFIQPKRELPFGNGIVVASVHPDWMRLKHGLS